MAEYIREVVLSKSGNYMIFFPSYQYMEQVEYAVETWTSQRISWSRDRA